MSGPTKDEDPTVAAAGLQGLAQAVSLNSATSAAEDKAFHTLRARLALAGQTLSRSNGDDGPVRFYVSRWNLIRELRTLDDVLRFAALVGVTP